MALCGLFALLIGYLAGLRFRIPVVVLLELAAGAVAIGCALSGRVDGGSAGLGFVIFGIAVQAGYGLALMYPIRLPHAPRPPVKA